MGTLAVEFDWGDSVTSVRVGAALTRHYYSVVRSHGYSLVDTALPVEVTFAIETGPRVPELAGRLWMCEDRLLFERYDEGGCGHGFRRAR